MWGDATRVQRNARQAAGSGRASREAAAPPPTVFTAASAASARSSGCNSGSDPYAAAPASSALHLLRNRSRRGDPRLAQLLQHPAHQHHRRHLSSSSGATQVVR